MNENLRHLTELFKSNISTAVRDHKDFRPFYCEGNPYKANVFLIGQNPATPDLRVSWWDFWSETQGFDFKRFDTVNEKKRGGEPSKTRKLLDELKPRLNTLYWLETNAWPIATNSNHPPPTHLRDTTALSILLHEISPRGVFAYGNPARDAVAQSLGLRLADLPKDNICMIKGVLVITRSHISRKISASEMRTIGDRFYRVLELGRDLPE